MISVAFCSIVKYCLLFLPLWPILLHSIAQALDLYVWDFLLDYLHSWFYFVGLQLLWHTRLLMGLVGDCYVYWDDLRGLSGTSYQGPLVIPGSSSSSINLPLPSSFLSHYPDCRLASYILLGSKDGFHIGLAAPVTIRSSSHNHPSCQSCLGVNTNYISA